jgi:hypothetical protein
MARQIPAHRFRLLFPKASAAFDVGVKKGNDAGQ